MKNYDGDWWRPGMDWFKPKLVTCQTPGCCYKYYQRAQTGRKYCDECIALIERRKLERTIAKYGDKKRGQK